MKYYNKVRAAALVLLIILYPFLGFNKSLIVIGVLTVGLGIRNAIERHQQKSATDSSVESASDAD